MCYHYTKLASATVSFAANTYCRPAHVALLVASRYTLPG